MFMKFLMLRGVWFAPLRCMWMLSKAFDKNHYLKLEIMQSWGFKAGKISVDMLKHFA